ncbi:MAG: hypothetical protein M3235_16310 [Actinomycetota bacterium]|nr:hypothetical protein [Actinomycetota bacterium]
MTRVHIKGFVLQKLLADGPLWDHEVVAAVENEYGVSGEYWAGTVRMTLTDLYSGGLLDEVGADVDGGGAGEKVTLRYQVNDFGRERMTQSGLLEAVR